MTSSNKSIPAITDTKSYYYAEANKLFNEGIKYYLNHTSGNDEVYLKAYWSFYSAYKRGLMKSAFWVGMCFQYGHGVEKNYNAANSYFKKFIAYERDARLHSDDYAEALYILSQNLRLGRGTTQDEVKANKFLERAAKCEFSQAQYEWGTRLLFGLEVVQNVHDGIEYLKAATKSRKGSVTSFVHPDAAATLGWCYNMGYGVNQDYGKAMKYFRAARNQGNYAGQYALGETLMDIEKTMIVRKVQIKTQMAQTEQEHIENPSLANRPY